MTAKPSARVDVRRSIIRARLADVAVRDSPNLSAVLVAVGELGRTLAQLARRFGFGEGQEARD
jgi:hypothetical protein